MSTCPKKWKLKNGPRLPTLLFVLLLFCSRSLLSMIQMKKTHQFFVATVGTRFVFCVPQGHYPIHWHYWYSKSNGVFVFFTATATGYEMRHLTTHFLPDTTAHAVDHIDEFRLDKQEHEHFKIFSRLSRLYNFFGRSWRMSFTSSSFFLKPVNTTTIPTIARVYMGRVILGKDSFFSASCNSAVGPNILREQI